MVRVGPAGWMYKDWQGVVYPKPKPRRFNELEYISRYFDAVEINSSFYGPPRPNAAAAWTESISHNPKFRFTAKLYQSFTHSRKPTAGEERDFKAGIEPIVAAGRLGGLLAQFPWSFKQEPENRTYLTALLRRFREYPMVVEVRHSSWITDDLLEMLGELGVGIVNIDQPLFHRSVRPAALMTSRIAYVRLHGRNYKNWFSARADVRERYDYRYDRAELEPWVDRIRTMERDADEVYAITNNHNLGKAAANALEIASLLRDQPVQIPPTLMTRYPDLFEISAPNHTLSAN